MSEPRIVDANGQLARRDDRCPRCGAGKDKRINTAGFGPPIVCCEKCGYEYPAGTEARE